MASLRLRGLAFGLAAQFELRLSGLTLSKPIKCLSKWAARLISSSSGCLAMLISDWQVQPCKVELGQRVKEIGAIVGIGGEVEPKVIVGEEETLDAAALDLIHHFIHGAQAHRAH